MNPAVGVCPVKPHSWRPSSFDFGDEPHAHTPHFINLSYSDMRTPCYWDTHLEVINHVTQPKGNYLAE